MELTNKQIIDLGIANEIFSNSISNNPELSDKISIKLKMIIEYNTQSNNSFYQSLVKEEKRIADKFHGLNLGILGWAFFASEEEKEKFNSKSSEFEKEINKALKTSDSDKIDKILNKFIPSNDTSTANRDSFLKEWNDKVSDKETIDVDIKKIKPEWFNDICSKDLNNLFIKNYIAAKAVEI